MSERDNPAATAKLSPQDALLILRCAPAMASMRAAGMSETAIALVVNDIRSAAINYEFDRLQTVILHAPPTHWPWPDMVSAIREASYD